MRGVLLSACAALVVTVTASVASGSPIRKISPPASGLTVVASPPVAGARHVRLTLVMRYEMQCNYPGAGPLTVVLPRQASVPNELQVGSVLLGGKATEAKIAGTTVTVVIAPPTGVMCDAMGPGMLQLVFTPRAGLGNPARSGSYRVRVVHARHSFTAVLRVTARP